MDETMRLIRKSHEGDKEARDRLVMENVGLIWSIVRRFSGRGHRDGRPVSNWKHRSDEGD